MGSRVNLKVVITSCGSTVSGTSSSEHDANNAIAKIEIVKKFTFFICFGF
jgi:hypothetical protein